MLTHSEETAAGRAIAKAIDGDDDLVVAIAASTDCDSPLRVVDAAQHIFDSVRAELALAGFEIVRKP